MKGKVIIRGINDILGKNDIPWRFDEQEYNVDYRERNNCPEPTSSGPWNGNKFEKKIRPVGKPGINVFPSDVTGDLYDDFLGICGCHSGNNSLRETFLKMADWAKAHVEQGSRQRLTAVILTDKWNAAQYEDQCVDFKDLDIRLVVILCVGDVAVQLPYVYSDRTVWEFIKSHDFTDEQAAAIKHVARIIRSGHRVDSLADLTGVDNDAVYDMAHIAFGHEINDVLRDLNKEL